MKRHIACRCQLDSTHTFGEHSGVRCYHKPGVCPHPAEYTIEALNKPDLHLCEACAYEEDTFATITDSPLNLHTA